MRVICFEAQHAAIAAILDPVLKIDGGLTVVKPAADMAWGHALREVAKPGDVLAVCGTHETRVTADVFAAAREIGMAMWSLSDHWIKPAATKDADAGGEPAADQVARAGD